MSGLTEVCRKTEISQIEETINEIENLIASTSERKLCLNLNETYR